jgi:hypothetical protein
LLRIDRSRPEAGITVFVITRQGSLVAAGRLTGRNVNLADIRDPGIIADFRNEQRLWAERGRVEVCR